jgi:YegS/Rv2252/BmrU family lipid kinase
MRAALIANPRAGADRALDLIPLIGERLRALVSELEITITTDAAAATLAAARARAAGCDALFVAGGDGTLNAALRGVVAGAGSPRAMPIGVIPLGTGNDFAKALGLGEDPEAALDALLEARVIDVDLGLLNDRPFANTSAGGFIADVSVAVTETLKDVAGKLAYLIGGARALLGTEPFSARLIVNAGNADLKSPPAASIDVQMFAVCNARFIGGGYLIAPDALIDDGLLEVLVAPAMPLLEFIGVLQRIAVGDDVGRPDVVRFRSSSFDLVFDRPVRVNTDGELLETDGCRYRVMHGGARFFCGTHPQASARPVPLEQASPP